MKKLIVAVVTAVALGSSMSASAWGDKEQGILIGIGAAILGTQAVKHHRAHQGYPVYTGCSHGATTCSHPYGAPSNSGVISAYERGLRQRLENEQRRYGIDRHLREMQDRAEYRAYRCGINPAEC